jgi:glycosyltransferase involved in cell wall biosynthesis
LAQRLAHVESSALVLRLSNTLVEGRTWSRRRRRLWAARHFYRGADGIAVVAPGLRDELVRLIPELEERAWLIVNPVIDELLRQRAQDDPDARWGLDDSDLIVGVGRLVPQKDFSTLVRAFAALKTDRRTRLLILGEGPERGALEQLTVELGIRERVALPGFARNPFPALRRADVVVSSSRWEGLPGVLVEALALGRPVVSTDTPSARAVLGEHSPHPVVPIGDAPAMARAIAAQLANPPAAELSQKKVEHFTVEAGARAMLDLLREVSARRRSPVPRASRS